jgi:hypothetical protein
MWVAVGSGTNKIAYSYDGLTWTPVTNSTSFFSNEGHAVAWNGIMWVAVGQGTSHQIAYSFDGINWKGVGTYFTQAGNGVAWNGQKWVVIGGSVGIAYSSNGISWSIVSTSLYNDFGSKLAWNGIMFVSVGRGYLDGPIYVCYSYDGENWTNSTSGSNLFYPQAYDVAWNGIIWVAVGSGGNGAAYSYNGMDWTSSSNFGSMGITPIGISWNGIRWIVLGAGSTNSAAYSYDGNIWYSSGKIFTTVGHGVAGNPNVGATIVDSAITLNSTIFPQTNKLDIVSGDYYNSGFKNFSSNILSIEK